jgi:hypothetical protein
MGFDLDEKWISSCGNWWNFGGKWWKRWRFEWEVIECWKRWMSRLRLEMTAFESYWTSQRSFEPFLGWRGRREVFEPYLASARSFWISLNDKDWTESKWIIKPTVQCNRLENSNSYLTVTNLIVIQNHTDWSPTRKYSNIASISRFPPQIQLQVFNSNRFSSPKHVNSRLIQSEIFTSRSFTLSSSIQHLDSNFPMFICLY